MKKSAFILILLLVITSCATQKNNSKKISIEIKTNKGKFLKNDYIKLYVNFINNSNQDITILKPSTKYGSQIDFFSSKVENCLIENYLFGTLADTRIIERIESELITIKAKSKVKLKISGNLYDLFCNNSNHINVRIIYDSNELPKLNMNEYNEKQKENLEKLYNKITKIKVESSNTKIKLN